MYDAAFAATRRAIQQRGESGKARTGDDGKGVMNQFTRMQQAIVSPVLARHGKEVFSSNPELMIEAVENPRGALKCLAKLRASLDEAGYNKVVICSAQTEPLHIARSYLEHVGVETGEVLQFDGDVGPMSRRKATEIFVKPGEKATMYLSVGAGGVGVHLVGEPSEKSAMVFFGPLPPSPMELYQAMKRIHRIGQEHPVKVYYLLAPHSMDYAITKSHEEKADLSRFVMGDDEEALGESGQLALKAMEHAFVNGTDADVRATGTTWKHMTGYMKVCKRMQEDGNLPPVDDAQTKMEREKAAEEANSMDAPGVSVHRGFPLPKRRGGGKAPASLGSLAPSESVESPGSPSMAM